MASTLNVILRNDTGSAQLYAHITGRDDKGVVILSSDGKTAVRPANPSRTLQPLGADCAIPIGASGTTRTISIPRIFGARIWFCKEKPLNFFINPGPALVEPSATNPADPNYDLDWGFCEFTWNQQELYANISFVDFVGLPISLQLKTGDGKVKTVPGMPSDGLDKVCSGLEAQAKIDGKGWDKLVIRSSAGAYLRALSPNSGSVLTRGLFDGYYQSYVDSVWNKYTSEDLTVNTQFTWGDVVGRVKDGKLTFGSVGSFGKPSALDIFTCSTGPFAAGPGVTDEKLNIGARLAAALNRSTLLVDARQPEGEKINMYYKDAVTNHYSRICHQVSVQGRGYAFPYDDVGPSSGEDQSGFVNDPNPQELTVSVGRPLQG
ncbi:CBM6-containing protein [Metarhizium album ARSEF 1941]|uniref:CBM6-containing protein n=1 Tax=Metarhizium album (strain ARSEF 1941) TaxID=1081103 RepID=A0A0B2X3E0_METAS|nr:CBM6-containing protein [Metarhizium album ARSEF 1941]KHO00859.1 CBM6-containing protein [Metarhizium album ARSEF 1941]